MPQKHTTKRRTLRSMGKDVKGHEPGVDPQGFGKQSSASRTFAAICSNALSQPAKGAAAVTSSRRVRLNAQLQELPHHCHFRDSIPSAS